MPRLRPIRAGDTGTSGDADLEDGTRSRAYASAIQVVPYEVRAIEPRPASEKLLPQPADGDGSMQVGDGLSFNTNSLGPSR